MMNIYIKNMACLHCKDIVRSELRKLGLKRTVINQGEIKISEDVSPSKREQLNFALKRSGFELMDPEKVQIVRRVRNIIDDMVHLSDEQMKTYLPGFISKKMKLDYKYISDLFTEVYNTTIEKYFVIAKIEKAKELLVYYRLNPIEVSYQLNYNNVAHLSNQFREVTGITPGKFQNIKYVRQTAQQSA